ncbi:juvenile hormone epoxide hydrolase-like [Trichoplusia ni]|uniref:Epoxide hydrolase n=1 Tax=Trichoplusia ni TaxID=7111 RepID=A0A7E5WBB1_TRINI|nr:juvenile hormone epoxide hydrolase-like [Trichoplusia ni]
MNKLIGIIVFCTLVFSVQNSMIESDSATLPKIDAWWGPEDGKANQDTSIRPFKIKFEEEMITDLRYRLKNHRPVTPPLEGSNFTYGFNTNNLENWVNYWADSYNFTAREEFMNQFPHFKTNIQGLDIHFMRIKPEVPEGVEVIPLLISHGWPGSFLEFYKAAPLISEAYEKTGFAVEIIVPSLPGFGFSSGAVRQGLGASEIAVVFRNLMHRIGHKTFYIQGGDWGSVICASLSTLFPDEVLGFHSNFAVSYAIGTWATWFGGFPNKAFQDLIVQPSMANRLFPLATVFLGTVAESGYMHLQATKPDTLGVAFSDSPSGLLAYILQTVSGAIRSTNKNREDGGLYDYFTQDELIDNLMVYWMNNAFTTSIRIYAESLNTRNVNAGVHSIKTTVPYWSLQALNELRYLSPAMLKQKFPNLLNQTILDDGGHFLAWELPEVFSESVLTAITEFKKVQSNRICKVEL